MVPISFEQPPREDDSHVPTRAEIAQALNERLHTWAIVARCDRAARAAAMVARINDGREYGDGFEALARRIGNEHRVYARKV